MKKMGVEVARISQSLKDVGALKPLGQPVKELLTKHVERLCKRIQFLEQQIVMLTQKQPKEKNNEQSIRTNGQGGQSGISHIQTRSK